METLQKSITALESLEQEQLKIIMDQIEELMKGDTFTPLEAEIVRSKYIDLEKTVDIRRLSRAHKMPMKHIKREIEKTERKLFNLLKNHV